MKLGNILILILLIGGTFYVTQRWFPREEVVTKTHTVTDTVRDTIVQRKQLPAPEPDTVIQIVRDSIKVPTENKITAEYVALYQKYMAVNIYDRVLKDDSTAYIRLQDTVTQNTIQGRSPFVFKNRRPTQITHTTTTTKRYKTRRLYLGANIGPTVAQPSVMYKDLNGTLYQVGYNFTGPAKGPRVGVHFSVFSGF